MGGVAVNAHGFQRFTRDLDLVIDLEPLNLKNAMEVFSSLGFESRVPVKIQDFLDEKTRTQWIEEKNMTVFSLVSNDLGGLVVDLFAYLPFNFESTFEKSFQDQLEDTSCPISFIDLDSLIEMKRCAGRDIDLRDVEELLAIKNELKS